MEEQIVSFVSSVVAGLVTNGIQGIYQYITQKNLQDRIVDVITEVKNCYEQEYHCEDKSLFIWEENIRYYVQWLQEGFLPREAVEPPVRYGEDMGRCVSQKELDFIYAKMDSLVRKDTELRSLHASLVCDDIYRMLQGRDRLEKNSGYYEYVKSFGNVLFLHKGEGQYAITLKDTYIQPAYRFAVQSNRQELAGISDMKALLQKICEDCHNRFIIIEGDAGVGKSSLISYLCYSNEKQVQESGNGIVDKTAFYCIRLRNLTANQGFIDFPVREIIKELGFQSYEEFEKDSGKKVLFLDGFDELCMLDGMTEFAESILLEIIRGFPNVHIVITTRPKFIDVFKLKEKGTGTGIVYILLRHFDAPKRDEWVWKYRQVCGKEDYPKLEKISQIEDEHSEGICDTPLALYMLAAGKITDEAWNNPWVLYHQIFCEELSNTEYNRIFSMDSYTHGIGRYNEVLYRISAEIAYKMYRTGNKKLYVMQRDIEEIVDSLNLKTSQTEQLVKRCYALCNYWKNDGKRGMAEFYHNNIRDFFLCEKVFFELERIYRVFDSDNLMDDEKRKEMVDYFVVSLGDLFLYSDFNDKVAEFIFYRSLYKKESQTEEEFVLQELKYQFLGYFFEQMFTCGAVREYRYDGKRNIWQENMNVLKCVVQIYRHIYEPYVRNGKRRLEWFFNVASEMGGLEYLASLFRSVFIRTPLTVTDEYSIPVAGYANFNLYDMKKADLRYGMFNYSKFISCDFSDTILKSTDFTGAILKDCSFLNADLSYSSLLNAEVTGCKFENCNLVGATLPDGFCSNAQQEQEEHLRDWMQHSETKKYGGVRQI